MGAPAVPDRVARAAAVLATPLLTLRGVGPKVSEKLAAKGLRTLGDALAFLPIRHEDRTRLLPLARLQPGEAAAFTGELVYLDVRRAGRRATLEGMLRDGSGTLALKWFRGNFEWLLKRYQPGMRLIGHGPVRVFRGVREVHHPELEILEAEELHPETEGVVPVYSEVEGVHPKALRRIMRQAVEAAASAVANPVPAEGLAAVGEDPAAWERLGEAWRELHFPSRGGEGLDERLSRCRRMVVLEEFFFLQLGLLLKRGGDAARSGIAFRPTFRLIKPLLASLPFELTAAQRRVLGEIRRDMEAPRPMHRLLQGDVGSGKTLVALNAALMAVESGYQAAIMAPTEVLAEQHYANLSRLTGGLPVTVELFTGSITGERRERVAGALALGGVDIVVGTHALIQEDVAFARLGLVVVDEQHRFGVAQRAELAKKGREPDLLVMTATPIPRSLSMTVYGDLDLSVIDQMPPGRTPVATRLVRGARRDEVHAFVRDEVAKGRQAYVVYPLVEESEKMELRSAVESAESFASHVFPDLKVGLLHGRMRGEQKEAALADFYEGRTQVLVCTTVIEVGIDVPNASVMVVEHAERFGLSQLHQLRGRVGRGQHRSYCLLLAEGRLSEEAFRRLKIMEKTEDGFQIAEEDLKIRGPGDMLGTRQSGLPDFRIGNIVRDGPLLETARRMAHAVLGGDPALAKPEHALLRKILYERWAEKLALVQSG